MVQEVEGDRHEVAIGVGSNVRPRAAAVTEAVASLPAVGINVVAVSRIYETAALLPEGAPSEWNMPYLNMVVRGFSRESPVVVLSRLKEVEQRIGRREGPRWGPRRIDLDILVWGRQRVVTQELQIPHPGIELRPFVYVPLLEVWPEVEIGGDEGWYALATRALPQPLEGGILRLYGAETIGKKLRPVNGLNRVRSCREKTQ